MRRHTPTHYVIIGNGVAGIEAAFQIRERRDANQARITVISDESDYFFSRTALMYAYMDKLDRRDMEPYERKVYDEKAIDRLRARVDDLDAQAHQITLEGGETIAYDKLLLAVGAVPRMVAFDGLERVNDGIVHLVSLQDLDDAERLTWSTQQAVVVGGGLIGVELAECLRHHGIEVTFLVREPYFWPMALGREEAAIVGEHIGEHGVDLRLREELDEILVDARGRVSAVRTDAGDTIDCQMLGVCIGVMPNTGWLDDATTPPVLGRGIVVDRSFKTSLPDVWAAGDCAEIDIGEERGMLETIWYAARRHGRLAGQSMLGEPVDYRAPLFYNSTKFFDVEFTTVGHVVDVPEGTQSVFRRMADKPISQRIVFNDDRQVIGFNMLGSRWNHTVLEDWIKDRRDVDWVLARLDEATFDPEFTRLDLAKMDEKEVRL